jgi:hypothetical protein
MPSLRPDETYHLIDPPGPSAPVAELEAALALYRGMPQVETVRQAIADTEEDLALARARDAAAGGDRATDASGA